MRKIQGQIFIEYGLLIVIVVAAMLLFSFFLKQVVDQKTNAFEDNLTVRRQIPFE